LNVDAVLILTGLQATGESPTPATQ